MKITYLTQLSTFNERPFPNEGLTLVQIQDLRDKFNNGKSFPKAFEEYLYLAGIYNNIGLNGPDTIEELQKEMAADLEESNQKMERPWMAYHEIYSNYGFIFLDETAEDPKCFICEPEKGKANRQNLFREPGYTFTEMVNERIRRLKDGTF